MSKMKIVAMKLTDDIDSIKVAYYKNGTLYVRDGDDGFENGTKAITDLSGLGKWGFRKVDEPQPEFRDAEELIDHLDKFTMDNNGIIKYYG